MNGMVIALRGLRAYWRIEKSVGNTVMGSTESLCVYGRNQGEQLI